MPASTQARITIGGEVIEEVKEFTYSSDALAVGEECEVTVVNHRSKYGSSDLGLAQPARLEMANGDVNGGAWTRRHQGLIVRRAARTDLITATIADIGWHLMNSCAPLFYRLRKGSLDMLADPRLKGSITNEALNHFGFTGYRRDNTVNRTQRLGRAQAQLDEKNVLPPLHSVQVEPGDTYFDKLVEFARRSNGLINVAVDGVLQVWNPNYKRAPAYELRRTANGPNNILDGERHEDLSTRYTEVECVGEQLAYVKINNNNDPNATKKRGKTNQKTKDLPADQRNPWPFVHRLTLADSEMYNEGLAAAVAGWWYRRGLFDAFYVQYTVADHWQRSTQHPEGIWWEADAMVSVEDDELDLHGLFWLQSVRAQSGEKGDLTDLVLRLPGLLTPSFGVYPSPPRLQTKPKKEPGT